MIYRNVNNNMLYMVINGIMHCKRDAETEWRVSTFGDNIKALLNTARFTPVLYDLENK